MTGSGGELAEQLIRRGGAARLPAVVPRPVQLFVITLVLILWNRDAAAAAS